MADKLRTIDLNADLGEGFGPWRMGDDEALLGLVTSANVACGGHAGDPETMFRTLSLARQRGVRVGAHPSFPDKQGFGRRLLPRAPEEIERFVAAQVGALIAIGALAGCPVSYVKPHGALANLAAADGAAAGAIARATLAVDPRLAILAISGTRLEAAAQAAGLAAFSEVFADRGYQPTGQLTPRGAPGAMIDDPRVAADRLVAFLETGLMPTSDGAGVRLVAHSVCVHGDSPGAVEMARQVRAALEQGGLEIRPFIGDVPTR